MKNKQKISPSSTSDTFAENIPAISVPFPPNITSDDYLKRRIDGSLPNKSVNSFMLYRIAFNKEFRTKGLNVRQRILSRQVSDSWQNEPEHVKRMYRHLAIKAQQELDQLRTCNFGSVPLFIFAAKPFNSDIINDDSPGAEAAPNSIQITSTNSNHDEKNPFNSDNIYFNENDDSSMFFPAEAAPDSFQITSVNNNNNGENSFNSDNINSYETVINDNSPMFSPIEAAPDSFQIINNDNNDETTFNSDNIDSCGIVINDNSPTFFPAEAVPDSIQIINNDNNNKTPFNLDNINSYENIINEYSPIFFSAEATPVSIQINFTNYNSDNINYYENIINDNSSMLFPTEAASDSFQITSINNDINDENPFNSIMINDNSPMLFPTEAVPDSIQTTSTTNNENYIQDSKNHLNNFLQISSDGTFINYSTF
ncbi:10432_t:CDS:1 [Ambispora leptoticha]|uniref:10432_t:CDS:1 n=1 Tax=Ambispora leptoticha TaxID=144679 RepID=A0A9N9FA44_9GLOM|nr:10432_t:CDS:1 [Ambispora leptoticha]